MLTRRAGIIIIVTRRRCIFDVTFRELIDYTARVNFETVKSTDDDLIYGVSIGTLARRGAREKIG